MCQGPTLNYIIIATSQNFEHHHISVTDFRTRTKYKIFIHALIEKSSG